MTANATIIIASELGSNLGHLGRSLALARAYRAKGFNVVLVATNLAAARVFFGAEDFMVLQAPVLRQTETATRPALTLADMLWNVGFGEEAALSVAVDAWVALLEQLKPAFVVYNNAPVALVASRLTQIPTLLVGSGFEIPPTIAGHSPQAEESVVRSINVQLARGGIPELRRLSDLFPAGDTYLSTCAEFDPAGPRPEVVYIGPVFELPHVRDYSWGLADTEHRSEHKIFAYLGPATPACESILQALQRSGAEVVCVMSPCPKDWIARYDRLLFFVDPLPLATLLPGASMVVTCSSGLATTALLAGVPVLMAPMTTEQFLAGSAAERAGLLRLLRGTSSVNEIAAAVDDLLHLVQLRERALDFAASNMQVQFENNAPRIEWLPFESSSSPRNDREHYGSIDV